MSAKPLSDTTFRKRTFSLGLLIACAQAALTHLPVQLRSLSRPHTSAALREKIMLAVTSVNDCRYCQWVHTGLALKADVDLASLREVLRAESLGDAMGPDEAAVLFAKHYADTVRQPTPEAVRTLGQHWDAAQVREIMAHIHGIYFSNLCGNSMDAWLARLRGQKVEDGHPFAEALAAIISAPSLGLIWLSHRRRIRQIG